MKLDFGTFGRPTLIFQPKVWSKLSFFCYISYVAALNISYVSLKTRFSQCWSRVDPLFWLHRLKMITKAWIASKFSDGTFDKLSFISSFVWKSEKSKHFESFEFCYFESKNFRPSKIRKFENSDSLVLTSFASHWNPKCDHLTCVPVIIFRHFWSIIQIITHHKLGNTLDCKIPEIAHIKIQHLVMTHNLWVEFSRPISLMYIWPDFNTQFYQRNHVIAEILTMHLEVALRNSSKLWKYSPYKT